MASPLYQLTEEPVESEEFVLVALAAPLFNHQGELADVIAALGPSGFFDDSTDGK